MPIHLHPDLDQGSVDPAPHIVTDEELQLLLSHDHEERRLVSRLRRQGLFACGRVAHREGEVLRAAVPGSAGG